MKRSFILFFVLSTCFFASGQRVDQFTGAFSYNLPLLHVPSDRGDGINIDASYRAGIQMEQAASEIGLGWNINAGGAIYRTVSVFPDDAEKYMETDMITNAHTIGRGALYPAAKSGITDYDLITTSKSVALDTMDFTMPAFDGFSVDAPGFGGQMKLSYMRFYKYNKINGKLKPQIDAGAVPYKKPQFHFIGDFSDTLVSRHYPDTITSSTKFRAPSDTVVGLGFSSGNTQPFIGKHLNGSTISNQNLDTSSGRLASSNFVEYFTNREIEIASVGSFSSTTDPLTNAGVFIDYKSTHTRDTTIFPPGGIGYFRITASNGLTYHYSLPVYEFKTVNYSAPLNNDLSIPSCLTGGFSYNLSNPDTEVFSPNNPSLTIKYTQRNKYAIQWELTAITGRDYVDANNNHLADAGDGGYWVSYDYQKWSSDFIKRVPQYGYNRTYSQPDISISYLPVYYPTEAASPGYPFKLSGFFATAQLSHTEQYYLSKIQTSSHTAIFIRDIRKDEKGGDSAAYLPSGFKSAPSLYLKSISLFNNSDFSSFSSPTYANSNFSNYSAYDLSNVNTSCLIYTSAWSGGTPLKSIAFDQDYSLCRKYHGNIEVGCPGSYPLMNDATVQSTLTVGTYTSSGKLSLNRILVYENGGTKVTPSTLFNYTATGNPDYNPLKADYWGFYKPDVTHKALSRYTNSYSKNYTQAWSLSSITNALGGITAMDYESNSYSSVIDVMKGLRGAAFIYRILDVDTLAFRDFDATMEEGDQAGDTLSEFLALYKSTLSGLSKVVCTPFAYAGDPTNSSVYPTSQCGLNYDTCTVLALVSTGGLTNKLHGSWPQDGCFRSNSDSPNYFYTGGSNSNNPTLHAYDPVASNYYQYFAYGGAGYFQFETPVGYEVYGGGIRVKHIKTQNSASESYVTEYTYENGVAGNEMDRFNYQVHRSYLGTSAWRYDYLQAKTFDLFEMSPTIGYGKVTVKDLGRINTANGKTETLFINSPTYNNNQFANYAVKTVTHTGTYTSSYNTYLHILHQCVSQFASVYGAAYQVSTFDKNNNCLSKTVYNYESTQQGALVENYYVEDTIHCSPLEIIGTVNIRKDIPVVLKSTISCGMGTVKVTETLVRDELTGEGTTIRSTGINGSSSLSYKVPAYKYYLPVEGLDFTTAASRKMLPYGEDLYVYSNVDSTLASSSFLNASYKTYSRNVRQLSYNASDGTMAPATTTLSGYLNTRNFRFDGGNGSLGSYGLPTKSALSTNPLNLASTRTVSIWEPSTTYNWRLVSEITLLDVKKHVLESRDENKRFSARKYCWNSFYVNATASNCNYASFSFADFEGPVNATYSNGAKRFDGEVLGTSYTINSSIAHTGKQSITVSTTAPLQFISASETTSGGLNLGLQPNRVYRASVWVDSINLANAEMDVIVIGTVGSHTLSTSVSNTYVANASNNLVTTIGRWNLIQTDFTIPYQFTTSGGGQFVIQLKSNSGSVNFDDFVFHPVESSFSANVIDGATGRISSTLDGNGMATNFVYDASGKTLEVWKEIGHATGARGVYKKIKANTYNYARGAAN